jgi:hypothetical protein
MLSTNYTYLKEFIKFSNVILFKVEMTFHSQVKP